jgi:hypothetical protein
MKDWELLPIGKNYIEEATEEMRTYLRDNIDILRETTDYNKITDFLTLHLLDSEKPVLGNSYIPVQVTSQSFATILFVRTLSGLGTLVSIDDVNRAYKFEYNNEIIVFPKEERKMGDMTQWGFLYKNKDDAKEFTTMLTLSFGHWTIKHIVDK